MLRNSQPHAPCILSLLTDHILRRVWLESARHLYSPNRYPMSTPPALTTAPLLIMYSTSLTTPAAHCTISLTITPYTNDLYTSFNRKVSINIHLSIQAPLSAVIVFSAYFISILPSYFSSFLLLLLLFFFLFSFSFISIFNPSTPSIPSTSLGHSLRHLMCQQLYRLFFPLSCLIPLDPRPVSFILITASTYYRLTTQ